VAICLGVLAATSFAVNMYTWLPLKKIKKVSKSVHVVEKSTLQQIRDMPRKDQVCESERLNA